MALGPMAMWSALRDRLAAPRSVMAKRLRAPYSTTFIAQWANGSLSALQP